MRKGAAVGVMAILGLVAVLHLIWAFGLTWPVSDVDTFQRTFYGEPGPMPPIWSAAILAVIFLVAGWFVVMRGWDRLPRPSALWLAGLWAMGIIFAIRGLTGYIPGMGGYFEPYVTLNSVVYCPLCLLVALLTFIVVWPRRQKGAGRHYKPEPPIPDVPKM